MLSRGYGCIIHDIPRKYKDINASDLRKLEKLRNKWNKPQLFKSILKHLVFFLNSYMLTFGISMSMTLYV